MSRQSVKEHEGSKYLRHIFGALGDKSYQGDGSMLVDVYEVLIAFKVECPATAHAVKKLLCAGLREKGDRLADLKGAMAALNRAIDIEEACNRPKGESAFELTSVEVKDGKVVEEMPSVYDINNNKGHWEVYNEANLLTNLGVSRVRWSLPNKEGKYLWVNHYAAHDGSSGPSLEWCKKAAQDYADKLNIAGSRPTEYKDGTLLGEIR